MTDAALIPDAAVDLIVTEEDSSEAYYTRHYTHFDWPEGASGPTIGIGYDTGYVTPAEAHADWSGIVDDATIAAITRACGLRGGSAQVFVQQHAGSVTITWAQAMQEFRQREIPKWMARCRAALPNFDKLPPLCQGAILSLSYNRGTGGYSDPSARDAEMRAIRAYMTTLQFDKIPAEIRAMRRLWPVGGDLWRRRGHEADLFQAGLTPAPAAAAAPLAALPAAVPVTPQPKV